MTEQNKAREKIDEILLLRIKSILMWGHNATEEEYQGNFDNCAHYHLEQIKEEMKHGSGELK